MICLAMVSYTWGGMTGILGGGGAFAPLRPPRIKPCTINTASTDTTCRPTKCFTRAAEQN